MIKSTIFVAKYRIKMSQKDDFMQIFCLFVAINVKKRMVLFFTAFESLEFRMQKKDL